MEIDQGLLDDLTGLGILIVVLAAGLLAHTIVYALLARVARRSETQLDESALEHTRNPTRLLFGVAAVFIALPLTAGDAAVKEFIREADLFIGILGLGWLAVGLTNVGYDTVMARFPTDVEDNREARAMQTQLRILQRFGVIIIWLLAIALALLTIPGVQALAASMLAGAGVIGIVLGVAAGPLIGNLIAGVQIAFTQPIRVDDVVVIEGEWGRIGEITAAYVVVDIWDKRQLVVPLSKIVDSPIENWTRDSAAVLGTVEIYTDYRADIEELRTELKRILDASGEWDGVAYSVLVTGASESTIKVRAMISAPDSGNAWDLRCLVREKLIAYLQRQHPEALPVRREIQHRDGTPDGADLAPEVT